MEVAVKRQAEAKRKFWRPDVQARLPALTAEFLFRIFTPETLTPDQQAKPKDWTPERRMVLTVLEDAVGLVLGSKPPTRLRDKREAQRWIESYAEIPFSFSWCCVCCGIDAEYLRQGIRDYVDRGEEPSYWAWRRRECVGGNMLIGSKQKNEKPEVSPELFR